MVNIGGNRIGNQLIEKVLKNTQYSFGESQALPKDIDEDNLKTEKRITMGRKTQCQKGIKYP